MKKNSIKKHQDWYNHKDYDPQKYAKAKEKYVQKHVETELKSNFEGYYSVSIFSKTGINYIRDLDVCLSFALANRKRMVEKNYRSNAFKNQNNQIH